MNAAENASDQSQKPSNSLDSSLFTLLPSPSFSNSSGASSINGSQITFKAPAGGGYTEFTLDLGSGFIASNILFGSTIFGITGSAGTPCTNNGSQGCLTNSSYVAGVPQTTNVTGTNGLLTITIPQGYYSGATRTIASDSNLSPSHIINTASIFGVNGTATVESHTNCTTDGSIGCVATATKVAGTPQPANVSGSNAALNITIPQGYYDGTTHTAASDTNLVSAKIKNGVNIFGVNGSAVIETHSNCATDGEIGCVTTATKVAGTPQSSNLTGTPSSLEVTIPQGYYDGTRKTTISDPNLVANKMCLGVTFFGVTGSSAPCYISFNATGNMGNAKFGHSSTLLPNGKVLIAGGLVNNVSTTYAELYDFQTGTFTATGTLNKGRSMHTATLLPNGKVLLTGGQEDGSGTFINSAELYDPQTETFTTTGTMAYTRSNHAATLLANGKVLVSGGYASASYGEIYDPQTGTFTNTTGAVLTSRSYFNAILLYNGKVLLAGGSNTPMMEVYDPQADTFSAVAPNGTNRSYAALAPLPNGKILFAGGGSTAVNTAQVYDPAANTWAATGSLLTARNNFAMTLLPNGKVLVTGGGSTNNTNNVEIYDPDTGTFSAGPPLLTNRYSHRAVLLPNGTVLITGGISPTLFTVQSSAELFQ